MVNSCLTLGCICWILKLIVNDLVLWDVALNVDESLYESDAFEIQGVSRW